MDQSQENKSSRLDYVIAFLIAVVSTTVALAAWRISAVSSSASDASRQGMLDSIKKQIATNENWRTTYEEANYAVNYAIFLAEVEAQEASGDAAAAAQATNLRLYLLPNLQLIASPLASEAKYLNPDGTYNLQERFAVLEAESPDLTNLDPNASFQLAGRYHAEQRWLTVAAVLLAISLFWLALAQIGGKSQRMLTMIIGIGVYLFGLIALVVIEAISFFSRGFAL